MDGQKPQQWGHDSHSQREIDRIEQIATQFSSHVGYLQHLDVVVPVLPEFLKRGWPHLGRHPQGSAKYRRLLVKCFRPMSGQLPEEGSVDNHYGDEQCSGGPSV